MVFLIFYYTTIPIFYCFFFLFGLFTEDPEVFLPKYSQNSNTSCCSLTEGIIDVWEVYPKGLLLWSEHGKRDFQCIIGIKFDGSQQMIQHAEYFTCDPLVSQPILIRLFSPLGVEFHALSIDSSYIFM